MTSRKYMACFLIALFTVQQLTVIAQAPVYVPNDPAKDPSIMNMAGRLYAYQRTHVSVQTEVVLAECDGPVREDHPDYAGRFYPHFNETSDPTYEADNPSELDHGGHSISAALAATDNGVGVISLGGLPGNLKGQAFKVMNSAGNVTNAAFKKCLQDVLVQRSVGINIRVIHGGWSNSQPDSSGETDQLITKLGDEGVLLVWGVGEGGKNLDVNPTWPIAYARNHWNVIPVMALRADGTPYPTSSTGSFVKFAAPGENIQVVSYFNGFNSVSFSGSTPASALFAASILVIELYRQPDARLALQLAEDTAAGTSIKSVDPYAALTASPVIATDSGNLTVATALEVGTDKVGPFKVNDEFPFSVDKTDKVSRIALNVEHLDFLTGEDLSTVQVEAVDSAGQHIFLPVEAIGLLSGTNGRYMQVQVRLAIKPTAAVPNPPQLATGTVSLTLTHHDLRSNTTTIQVVR